MTEFLARLKQRKLVQWALAYVAAAFALIQVIDVVASRFNWPVSLERSIILALAVGFVIALVIAWYHGEQGRQRVSAPELLMLALVLAIGGGVVWYFARAASAIRSPDGAQRNPGPVAAQPIPAKSIAVLPFQNLSGDPKQVYFSDGVTEEILNALAQIPDLKVAGRTSAFQFAGKSEDVRKVGAILGVATVLEGSVQKAGDEVRITAQLIDTRTGYQLWSEQYDRKLTNIFAVEDDISNAIMGKLKVQWTRVQPLVAQQAIDPRAHDFYLRGLALLAARGPGLRDAVAAFQNAIKIDPTYADAWGAMAEAQALLPSYYLEPAAAAYLAAQLSAQHALDIDANINSAYVALGYVYRAQWKWPEADAAFRRALKLAPSDAESINQYGQFLLTAGQLESSLAQLDRARALDPLSGIIAVERISVLTTLHRFDDASAQMEDAVRAYPQFALARFVAADVAVYRHEYGQAEAQLQAAANLVGQDPKNYSLLLDAIANPSKRAAARNFLKTLPVDARWGLAPYPRIWWLASLDDRTGVLDGMEHVRPGLIPAEYVFWQPAFDPIRNDPRFKAVLAKMGLPYVPKGESAP